MSRHVEAKEIMKTRFFNLNIHIYLREVEINFCPQAQKSARASWSLVPKGHSGPNFSTKSGRDHFQPNQLIKFESIDYQAERLFDLAVLIDLDLYVFLNLLEFGGNFEADIVEEIDFSGKDGSHCQGVKEYEGVCSNKLESTKRYERSVFRRNNTNEL
jgi:hypothetical protein